MRALLLLLIAFAAVKSHAEDEIRHYFEALDSGYNLPVHGDHLITNRELKEFYQKRNYQPVWYSGGRLIRAATQLYLMVETAGLDGLQPEDYHNRALQESCPAEQRDSLAYCDLLFSDAFFLLAQHLMVGKVNPETGTPGWREQQRQPNLVRLLETALAQEKVKTTLEGLRPKMLDYDRLMASLRRLRAATRYPEWNQLALSPAIEVGSQDPRLPAVIDRLVYWGDMERPATPIEIYDESVQQAIRRFQGRHGLPSDGVIGASTFEELNVDPMRRVQQIMANMERWRWLDQNPGPTHLMVNVAQAELQAVKNTQHAFVKSVEISQGHRDTPLFSGRLHYLVLNPGWTVPKPTARQVLLPAIRANPDFLANAGLSVFSGTAVVPPESVDWSGLAPANFDYRLVQSPGPRNALGQVVFMLSNPHHVYLHGTPVEDVFPTTDGGFNVGSIRVQDPLELAAWVVGVESQVKTLLDQGSPATVYLPEPVPVHITYRTAWVNSQGVLNFRKDIYQRDKPLYEALIQPLPLATAEH